MVSRSYINNLKRINWLFYLVKKRISKLFMLWVKKDKCVVLYYKLKKINRSFYAVNQSMEIGHQDVWYVFSGLPAVN